MRRLLRATLLCCSVSVFLAGCFLLSPDQRDNTFDLRIVVRPDAQEAAKVPCADPFSILVQRPDGEFRAMAVLYREKSCDQDERQTLREEVAAIPLEVGPVVDGGRDLTGTFKIDLGPKGSCYSIDVELMHLADDRVRDLRGEWTGQIVLEADLKVDVESLVLDATPTTVGSLTTFGGSILLSHPSIEEEQSPFNIVVTHDSDGGAVSARYLTQPVDFFDDQVLRRVQVAMEAAVQPTTIYGVFGLQIGELVAGEANNAPAEILLQPQGTVFPGGLVRLDTEITGGVAVQFENGDPAKPRATGSVRLLRSAAPCDQ